MKSKISWISVSCLMVIALVLTSCETVEDTDEGKVTIEDEGQIIVSEKGTEKVEEVIEEKGLLDPGVPKYGGTLTTIIGTDPMGFDYAYTRLMTSLSLQNEELTMGDWTKGPAGTMENDWSAGFGGNMQQLTGCLAETWSLPDDRTIAYTIRKGIHWWNKSPANGREFTPEDVAWNIERNFSAKSSYLTASYTRKGWNPTDITVDGDTVTMKVVPESQGLMLAVISDYLWHMCPDVVDTYGDGKDWKNIVGTGPYMLVDYVPSSQLRFERNPNYWQTDPINVGNELPYMDGLKQLIISDSSTQQAAFRTGKVDQMGMGLTWESKDLMLQQNPELMLKVNKGQGVNFPWGKINTGLPIEDIRVRQALNLAVNQQEILDDYYGGNADLLNWPYFDTPVFSNIYTPLEEQSQMVQDMFGYDPERAKALLMEAGYPDGFKTKIDCSTGHVDLLSIIREYLLGVGVDMEIAAHDFGVYWALRSAVSFEEYIYSNDMASLPFRMLCVGSTSVWNYAGFSSERTETALNEISKNIGKDDAYVAQVLKEIGPYHLEQSLAIYLPIPHTFTMWWPWLQNFYGASGGGGYFTPEQYITYCWLDPEMKEAMGY
ncbi:MAG: ABC transporter substrate-binding protein [Dehalococcoidales bacterium]|nr:MAG: ABC transporter substrate-binding protein [Dehalococcoidales bacterium]